ncbi:hypothetical protein SLEP1_g31425 [Rubroshorea leprosula]|uniref:Uncharacterized protein n=1 Tax=Rubroshorea leprosula TaxID=152421 RepID=A0AAV5KB81_9ROSI|nr:hypothetical protein SLEP1_g31425 [Rubroshorea leprosula]
MGSRIKLYTGFQRYYVLTSDNCLMLKLSYFSHLLHTVKEFSTD